MPLRNKERGSVLVEMALVTPVLLLLILGGFDLNRMINSKTTLDYVAMQTAQCMVHNTACVPDAFAAPLASGLGLSGSAPAIVVVPGFPCPFPPVTPGVPCSRLVTVTYSWPPVSPFFHPVTLTSAATAIQ